VGAYDSLNLPGVVRILACNGLQPVPRETVEAIRLALAGDRPCYPFRHLWSGNLVRLMEGPRAGVIGIMVELKEEKRKVVIEVELSRRAVAVELKDEAAESWPR